MKNRFENPSYTDNRHGAPGEHQRQHPKHHPLKQTRAESREAQEKNQREKQEDILTELEKQIDEDASNIGLVIASVFKTLAVAHGALPCMDLKTDLFHLVVNEACISVNVFDPECVKCVGFPDCLDEEDSNYDDYDDSDDFDEEDEEYEFED